MQCTNCGDSTHTFAVGIQIGGGGICSGTLIAPNVVLTARHCVSTTPATIDCATSTFGGVYAPSSFDIYTSQNLGGGTAYRVRTSGVTGGVSNTGIIIPSAAAVCGNDLALLVLTSNVPGGVYAEPVGQYPMTDHTRYDTTYTAIGYGNNGTSGGAGTRRIKESINMICIPGDAVRDCGPLAGKNLDAKEWAGGDGTCSGDSGSGAFNQTTFTQGKFQTMGILSRGGDDGNGNCVGSAYTRTDSWRTLIVQTVLTAASLGGYAAPAWTTPAPPSPDAGPGPTPDGGRPGSDGGGTSTDPKALGEECATADECASGSCSALGDGPSVCTRGCDDGANKCPDGFACKSGFCFASQGPTTPAATPTSTTTSSGCSAAPTRGGSDRAPLAALALVAAAILGRRRKPRSAA